MDIKLSKGIISKVNEISKEEQYNLNKLDISYEDLANNKIVAMILGHGVDTLNIDICETDNVDAVLALMLDAKTLNIIRVENCEASFKILSRVYPDKVGKLRRAKMLGKNLMEVL